MTRSPFSSRGASTLAGRFPQVRVQISLPGGANGEHANLAPPLPAVRRTGSGEVRGVTAPEAKQDGSSWAATSTAAPATAKGASPAPELTASPADESTPT